MRTNLQHLHDQRWGKAAIAGVTFIVLVTLFLASPWDGGDDWETFHGAARRLVDLDQRPFYGEKITHAYYSNPPWLAAFLLPLAALPLRVGWALVAAGTLGASALLLTRWEPGAHVVKMAALMLSPAMMYTVMHGQVDMLVLAGVFLPLEWWGLVALTKPQTALGLAVLVPPRLWLRAAIIVGVVVILSLIVLGPWPLDLIDQPSPFIDMEHNLWLNLWPFQVPAGVFLIVLGYSRKDERLLVAGSPLLSPYAAMSSMLGPWIAAITFLKPWQTLVVLLSWWGVVIARGLGYA